MPELSLGTDAAQAFDEADVGVAGTDWPEFAKLDFARLRLSMRQAPPR